MKHPLVFFCVPAVVTLVLASCGHDATGPESTTPGIIATAPIAAPVREVVYDAKRDLVFLAQSVKSQVLVLAGANLTAQPSIPFDAASIDVSAGGDSLFMVSATSPHFAIADLRTTPFTIDTVDLRVADSLNMVGVNVRALQAGKVFISMHYGQSGCGVGRLIEYDLSTTSYTVRSDLDCVTDDTRLARADNRSRMLLLTDDSCCPEYVKIFDMAVDRFTRDTGTVGWYSASISANVTGTKYLVGNLALTYDTLNHRLVEIDTIHIPTFPSGPSAISADGSAVYIFDGSTLKKYRLSSMSLEWSSSIPDDPNVLYALPNGSGLIASALTHVFLLRP